jgi:hypothetical protein
MLSIQLATWQNVLRARLDLLQASLDRLLLPAEVGPGGVPLEEKKGLPWWAILLIVLGVLVILCLCLMFLVPFILTLLGPSIGNVFDEIITELE